MEPKYIVAVEIGSSLIKGAIGAVDELGTLKVLAVEQREAIDCVRYGCIQNVEEVRQVIADIILSLEARVNIAPRKVKAVYVSLGGRSMASYRRDLEISFDEETEITNDVINQLLDEARLEQFADKEIVDVLPIGFMVDNLKQNNPNGTYGHNLKVALNIIACRPQIFKNLNRVIEEKLKLSINDYIVRQMAIAQLVLTSKEMQLGCVLVDFGAETTTVSIHKSGVLQSLVTIPLGSRNITRDLASLSITEDHAEMVKCSYINANPQETAGGGQYTGIIDNVDDVEVLNLAQYRAGEIVANITAQIKDANYKASDLSGGIVVVGRGAKLAGFNTLLESYSSFKVRSGMIPTKIQIADNSIQPTDVIDIVAILYAATQSNQDAIVECMLTPVSPKEEVIEEEEIIEMSSNNSNSEPLSIENTPQDDENDADDNDDEMAENDNDLNNRIEEDNKEKDEVAENKKVVSKKSPFAIGKKKGLFFYQAIKDKLNELISEQYDEFDDEEENDEK